MRATLRNIGNSTAVIIPKSFLVHLGVKVGDTLDLSLKTDRIILSYVKRHPRAGWAEASKKIAQSGTDMLVWTEFGNADDESFKW